MSMGLLGDTIDLHGGGSDLIFPHHECSRAQSEAATGATFVNHWMHTSMVAYEGTKMSKSLGNLVFVSDLIQIADPRAIRLALMRHHYRSDWEWFDGDIDAGAATLDRLYLAAQLSHGPDPKPFANRLKSALDNDLDAPGALNVLVELAEEIHNGGDDSTAPTMLAELSALVGVDLTNPPALLSNEPSTP